MKTGSQASRTILMGNRNVEQFKMGYGWTTTAITNTTLFVTQVFFFLSKVTYFSNTQMFFHDLAYSYAEGLE